MQKPKFETGDIVRRIPKEESEDWLITSGVEVGQWLEVDVCTRTIITFKGIDTAWSPDYFELFPEEPLEDQDSTKTPSDFLRQAADTLDERGKQYDASGSERSMEKTVSIFNILTGNSLTTAEGWQFMKVLKDVRLWSQTDSVHADSIIDNLGYTALLAEETLTLGGKLKHSDK
ncbi:hypothetical protein [Providencia phage PSTRCR_120]|uniref:Uncharacterized protein n=1 Tax=Providencia phage PSTRCR_120 TaxID=2800826 RepID=A0A7T7CKZ1_9CAUD|nr:hypothetical protein [Providencia phage PSTRCR_120]